LIYILLDGFRAVTDVAPCHFGGALVAVYAVTLIFSIPINAIYWNVEACALESGVSGRRWIAGFSARLIFLLLLSLFDTLLRYAGFIRWETIQHCTCIDVAPYGMHELPKAFEAQMDNRAVG
jgi:hypothetical protein